MTKTHNRRAAATHRPAALLLAGLLAAGAALFATLGFGSSSGTAAHSQYAPANTAAPTITGKAAQGEGLTVKEGTWAGTQPIVFEYQWLRCNDAGGNCVNIPSATAKLYTVAAADVNRTIRASVSASNNQGKSTALTVQTAKVTGPLGPVGPVGAIKLPNGETSIPVTSVPANERLIVDQVLFSPSPITSRTSPIQVRVKVKDTRGFVVRDVSVFVRSTPLVTRIDQNRQRTGQDGWIEYTDRPRATFPAIRNGFNIQYFVKAYRNGDPPLAGAAGYRLVQTPLRKR